MKNPLQITFHDRSHNPEIEELIREKFEKIKFEYPSVTKCHVILEKQSKHHQKANLACARLDLKVSRFEDIVVTEKCLEDTASMKSAVLKVFKQGLDMVRKQKKRRLENKRMPAGELQPVDAIDASDE